MTARGVVSDVGVSAEDICLGLDTVPKSDRPPVNLTQLSFQLMVAIGMLLALVVVLFWLARARRAGQSLVFFGFASLPARWPSRAGIGLGRHRSGPSTVDGVAGVAHHRRGQHELRIVVELHRGVDHHLGMTVRALVVLRSSPRRCLSVWLPTRCWGVPTSVLAFTI